MQFAVRFVGDPGDRFWLEQNYAAEAPGSFWATWKHASSKTRGVEQDIPWPERRDTSPAPMMSGGAVPMNAMFSDERHQLQPCLANQFQRRFDAKPTVRAFHARSGVGTYRYMAPEVVRYEQYTASQLQS